MSILKIVLVGKMADDLATFVAGLQRPSFMFIWRDA